MESDGAFSMIYSQPPKKDLLSACMRTCRCISFLVEVNLKLDIVWTTSIEEHLQEWPKKLSLVIAS